MKKKIAIGLGLACLAVLVVALVIYLSLGKIVKTGVETVGSTVTKCPVTVEDITFKPLKGTLKISNFVLGNPEGYKTASAFSVDEISIAMEPKSIFSGHILVKEVVVHGPQVTYEVGVLETNIGKIKKNVDAFLSALGGDEADEGKDAEKEEETPGAGKTVEIAYLLVDEGKINLSAKILQGKAASLPLPKLERTDLGKDDGEQSIPEMVAGVFDEILGSVLGVVKKSGVLIGDAAKKIGNVASDAGADIKKGVTGALGGVKGMFKKDSD